MKRGRSVEPVRLRRRMGSVHGRLARADGETIEIPGREDRRGLAGKFSCQRSSQLDGHQNRSAEVTARLSGGGRRLQTRAVRARRQGSYFLELLLADGETRQSAVADFARELLAVADNLQRALAAIGEEARRGEGSLIECVEATRRLLTLGRAFPRAPDRGAGHAFRSDAARSGGDGRERRSARNRRRRRRGWIHDQRPPAAACPRRAKARPNATSPSIAPEPQGETKVNEWQT